MVQSSHRELTEIGQKVSQTKLKDEEDLNERILLWLSPFPFHKQHDAILETVQAGTGGWFMKHEKVCNWLEGNISMLWCPGIRKYSEFYTMGKLTSGCLLALVKHD